MNRFQSALENLSIPVFAILLGLLVSAFFIAPAGLSPIDTYTRLFCEGFGPRGCDTFGDLLVVDIENEDTGAIEHHIGLFYGDRGHSLAIVLEQATPLILTALAATVAFKAGMFSIGMDGQFALGAVVAVFIGYWLPAQVYGVFGIEDPDTLSGPLWWAMHLTMPTIAIGAAMIVGAVYSWVAGILKVKLNVNELISTIILNAIAVQFVTYLINGPMRADMNNIARTERIDDTAWLVPFTRGILADVDWFSGSRLGIGIVLALLAGLFVWFYLWRSTAGYEQRMTQGARLFAGFGGINTGRAVLRAMLISGGLSGLAGAIQVLGVERRIVDGFVLSGTGFDGVLVAILARESVVGLFLVAVVFSGLQLGSINLQFGNIPRQLGGIIIALTILFTAMEDFFRRTITRLQIRMKSVGSKNSSLVDTPASGGD